MKKIARNLERFLIWHLLTHITNIMCNTLLPVSPFCLFLILVLAIFSVLDITFVE